MMIASPKLKSIESKSWTGALSNANKSRTESCTFIKHLISISVSNILFLRDVFSADNFESRVFEGMTIRFLKAEPVYPGAEIFRKWLSGAFEAVEKKYLRHLMLEIKDPGLERTLELYTMSFNYDEGNECMSFSFKSGGQLQSPKKSKFSLSDIQTKTIRLLQMCHTVTKTCASLPASVSVSMRLTYNDHTPDGYQPDGYKPCRAMTFEFPNSTRKIEIGVVETKYHSFKLISKTCLNNANFSRMDDFELNEEAQITENNNEKNSQGIFQTGAKNNENRCENNSQGIFEIRQEPSSDAGKCLEDICMETFRKPLTPTNLPIDNSKDRDIDSGSETDLSETQLALCTQRTNTLTLEENEENIPTIPYSQSLAAPYGNFSEVDAFEFPKSQENDSSDEKEQIIRCVCETTEKSSAVLQCSYCRYWAHAECYGISEADRLQENFKFFCVKCHGQTDAAICHDHILLNLDAPIQKKLASFRRVLNFCKNYRGKLLTINRIEKILGVKGKNKLCDIMIRKLTETGVAKPSNRKNNFSIDKEILMEKMPQYFYLLDDLLPKSGMNKRKRQDDEENETSTKKHKSSMTTYQRIDRKK